MAYTGRGSPFDLKNIFFRSSLALQILDDLSRHSALMLLVGADAPTRGVSRLRIPLVNIIATNYVKWSSGLNYKKKFPKFQ